MRILLIDHYAGSPKYGMEFRPYYLAREWYKEKHEVRIIAGSFSHLRNTEPDPGEEIIDDIKYFWLKTIKYKGNGILRFLLDIPVRFKAIYIFKKTHCRF